MSTRLAQKVRVEILQDDMVGFASGLPFPQLDFFGKKLFTEKVIWGEIWFADRSNRRMWQSGYVRDGSLFIDQSAREKFMDNRKHDKQKETLMLAGSYKVWLDAWVRMGDYTYASDPAFTTDAITGNGDPWRAPPAPEMKYWQDIEIKPPTQKGGTCQISVRSRRFHWLYRISRILDTLDQLLQAHEKVVATVATARNYAEYLRQFLGVLYDSGYNSNHIHIEQPNPTDDLTMNFCGMQARLLSTINAATNFINYGVCMADDSPIPERKHINNVAHLLWTLIHNQDFGREIALHDPVLAEEHRMLLSRLGHIFNRIPRVFSQVTPHDQYSVYASGESLHYGQEFALEFTFPYYSQKFGAAFPLLKGLSSTPASTVQFVNSLRRYTISMLNAASMFVVKEQVSAGSLVSLMDQEQKLWGQIGGAEDLFARANDYIQKYKAAGNDYWVKKIIANRESLLAESANVDPQIAQLRDELEDLRRQIDQKMQQKPQKVLDALKSSNPAVVYGVQMFEIYVKWAIAVEAWNAFRNSAGPAANDPWYAGKGMKFALKGLDAGGSTARFLGLHKMLRTAWLARGAEESVVASRLEVLGTVGKGMCAVADIGSAVVATYDLWGSTTYGDDLQKNFMPEDAVTIYGFHLVTWAGKCLVALGSVTEVANPTPLGKAMVLAVPVFAVLQAIGYLTQLIGDVGEAFAGYGAGEHKHFHDVHAALVDAVREANNAVSKRGWRGDFYPQKSWDEMHTFMESFHWTPVDPVLFKARLSPAAD